MEKASSHVSRSDSGVNLNDSKAYVGNTGSDEHQDTEKKNRRPSNGRRNGWYKHGSDVQKEWTGRPFRGEAVVIWLRAGLGATGTHMWQRSFFLFVFNISERKDTSYYIGDLNTFGQ